MPLSYLSFGTCSGILNEEGIFRTPLVSIMGHYYHIGWLIGRMIIGYKINSDDYEDDDRCHLLRQQYAPSHVLATTRGTVHGNSASKADMRQEMALQVHTI